MLESSLTSIFLPVYTGTKFFSFLPLHCCISTPLFYPHWHWVRHLSLLAWNIIMIFCLYYEFSSFLFSALSHYCHQNCDPKPHICWDHISLQKSSIRAGSVTWWLSTSLAGSRFQTQHSEEKKKSAAVQPQTPFPSHSFTHRGPRILPVVKRGSYVKWGSRSQTAIAKRCSR